MINNDERRVPGRREFLALGVGAFAVAIVPRALRPPRMLVRRSVPMMGTVADLAVVHRSSRHAHGAITAAIDALQYVERTMTRFRADSEIGRANLHAAGGEVRVGQHTAVVVTEALRWAEGTDGAFDPAIGRLIAAWNVGQRTSPPHERDVQRFVDRALYRSVEVRAAGDGRATRLLRFHDPDVALDLGGVAKGYGVDRAVAALRDWGIRDALVNVGGDLYAMGASDGGDAWQVGIRSPFDPHALALTIPLQDRAVATSGDYAQGFDYHGRRFHHLLDPRTGEPRACTVHTLSIVADDCMTADAAATALFGQPQQLVRHILGRLAPRAQLVHTA